VSGVASKPNSTVQSSPIWVLIGVALADSVAADLSSRSTGQQTRFRPCFK